MNYRRKRGQLDLTERLAIETGLCRGETFRKIARRIGRHPSTVSHEVLENRTCIQPNYCAGKDCIHARRCNRRGICGAEPYACRTACKYCKGVDCRTVCSVYVSVACHKPDSPPYVCNTCRNRRVCIKEKYLYTAVYADAASNRRRSESRQGIRLTDEQKKAVEDIVIPLLAAAATEAE